MKRKNLLVLAASMLVLAACSNSQPAESSPTASSAPAQSSSQPAASSSAQPSSSSARPSSSSSTPAPSSSTPAPSSSSSEASQVVTEEYYALPFGYSGKWEKGHTYSWTFDLENDISSVTFAFGAQMSYASHSDRSFYTSSVNADSSDAFESDPANDGTQRIIVKVNDVEVEVTHKTYGELGLTATELNYARVASFPVTAGKVKVEMTTHPNAGYRLSLGGEARLYYDPADVGPATSVEPPVVSSEDSSVEPPVVSSEDSSQEPPVVSSEDSSQEPPVVSSEGSGQEPPVVSSDDSAASEDTSVASSEEAKAVALTFQSTEDYTVVNSNGTADIAYAGVTWNSYKNFSAGIDASQFGSSKKLGIKVQNLGEAAAKIRFDICGEAGNIETGISAPGCEGVFVDAEYHGAYLVIPAGVTSSVEIEFDGVPTYMLAYIDSTWFEDQTDTTPHAGHLLFSDYQAL